jgi:hypothetical protein
LQQLDALTVPPPDAADESSVTGGAAEGGDDAAVSASSACTAAVAPMLSWDFDTTAEGWILSTGSSPEFTMSWVATNGDPTPGALEVDGPMAPDGSSEVGVVTVDFAPADLTGRTLSAWVRLDSGPSPRVLFFVQTRDPEAGAAAVDPTAGWGWADNGEIELSPGTWNCLSLPVSSPATNYPYDPMHVVDIGFEMFATAPFQLSIDSVRVE